VSLTFFGTDADIAGIWKWVFAIPSVKLFEQYSEIDGANRWFVAYEDALAYLQSGGRSLAAWSEVVGGRPRIEEIEFTPPTQRTLGGKGRSVLHSPAIIGIRSNNEQNGCLASASISCWTEKGARQRSNYSESFLNEVDWAALRSVVGKIQRMVTKASPAKMRSYPIMPDAFARLEAGQQSLWNWGTEIKSASPLITRR
jgi:hypothetical protein